MNPASRESQNARNPTSTPGFLAKSITCSGQITTINQSLPNSSRATFCVAWFKAQFRDLAAALRASFT
jgi:capsid protein